MLDEGVYVCVVCVCLCARVNARVCAGGRC